MVPIPQTFIVMKMSLTAEQIEQIHDHIDVGLKLGIAGALIQNKWNISEMRETISGWSFNTAFPMKEFLEKIGAEKVVWI